MKSLLLAMIWLLTATGMASAQKIRFTDTSNSWAMVALTSDPSSNPAFARYGRDTAMGVMVYHRLATIGTGVFDTLAVREDTLNGIIYFRFITPGFRDMQIDTLERILFDYNLDIGDTLKVDYPNYTLLHIV